MPKLVFEVELNANEGDEAIEAVNECLQILQGTFSNIVGLIDFGFETFATSRIER